MASLIHSGENSIFSIIEDFATDRLKQKDTSKGADPELLKKLVQCHGAGKHPRFLESKLENCFIIKHNGPGKVIYDVNGWCEKGKDPLTNSLKRLCSLSFNDFFVNTLIDRDYIMNARDTREDPNKVDWRTLMEIKDYQKEVDMTVLPTVVFVKDVERMQLLFTATNPRVSVIRCLRPNALGRPEL